MTWTNAPRISKTPGLDVDALFENLLTTEQLIIQLKTWLARDVARATVYRWVAEGLPVERIRGKLYFPKEQVALWLKRT